MNLFFFSETAGNICLLGYCQHWHSTLVFFWKFTFFFGETYFSVLDVHHYPSVVLKRRCFHASWNKKKKETGVKKKKKKKKHTHRDPAEDGMTVGCWRTALCHVNTYNLQSAVRLLINSFPCSYRVDTFSSPVSWFLWSLAEVITRQTAKELFDAVFL